jgi:type III pantothenate kinase
MNLAIDIGNSFTHFGLFKSNKLIKSFRFPSNQQASPETFDEIKSFLFNKEISKAGISSVIPEKIQYWSDLVQKLVNIQPVIISNKMKLPVKVKIKNSETVGTDRICNAVFGYLYFKKKENVIIVDLGTANTYDVVLKNGDFVGGIIAPGIETSAKAMHSNTAQLPELTYIDFKFGKSTIGNDTKEAIQSGIMNYPLFATEGIVKRIEKELKKKFKVIISGGNAKAIKERLPVKTIYAENTVLEGINMILNLSK